MDSRDIRARFLDYFRAQGHTIVESASLIPKDDPTLLFTNAGMVQFKRAFLGEENRGYSRAATAQKCVRAGGKHNDLENVGYTARHHTFFEMLGNFSFGDYFKEEAIAWGWELLVEGFHLPPERLHVSVFENDDQAFRIWEEKIGIPSARIARLGEKDNFWAMGETGPCGPCSEIYLDQGPTVGCGRPDCSPACDCDRFLEIWNLVFTQYDRRPDGALVPLPKPNIDTGMGLERLAAAVQGVNSNYETDLFRYLIEAVQALAGRTYGGDPRQDVAFRVIADHARAVAFLIGDGVMPSNEGRGYVLRRIIRRAVRFGQNLGLRQAFLHTVCNLVIDHMGRDYRELTLARRLIEGVVQNEERRFMETLQYSLKVLEEEIARMVGQGQDTISGEAAFRLYDTYGLSVDIVQDVAREQGLKVDLGGYDTAMARQRTRSQESWKGSGEEEIPEGYRRLLAQGVACRFTGYESLRHRARVQAILVEGQAASAVRQGDQAEIVVDATPFYGRSGGQVGDQGWIMADAGRFAVNDTLKMPSDLIVHQGVLEEGELAVGDTVEMRVDEEKRIAVQLNHSATHLLHAALRELLGDHVKQAGSSVTPERLRFDFSHFSAVSDEILSEVERVVNSHIRANLPVEVRLMQKEEAFQTGAMAIFEERYGDTVRLVNIGDGVSMELCGGTHTGRTGDIGLFVITGEGAVAANVRRIEALTGAQALRHAQGREQVLKAMAGVLKATLDQVPERVLRLLKETREKDREIERLKAKLLAQQSEDVLDHLRTVAGIQVLAQELAVDSPKELREAAERLRDRIKSGIIVVGARKEDKVMLACLVTPDLQGRFKAGQIIQKLSDLVGGKGGGRPDMAQGGGNQPERLGAALEAAYDIAAA